MPVKTLNERIRRAKKHGVPVSLKASDVGDTGPLLTHAEKKSKRVIAEGAPPDRNVSRKRPPGKGRNRRRTLTTGEATAAYSRQARPKWKAEGTRAEQGLKKSGSGRSRGSVNGRKKAPSQMKVRRAGGPRKRMPIHGG